MAQRPYAFNRPTMVPPDMMKALILAAGRGERMRPLTDAMPKPLLTAGGRTLIEWHLRAIESAGIKDVVVNLSWFGEQIRQSLADGADYGLRIDYSDEGPEALETGGGIRRALSLLGDAPFLVVNADVWTDCPLPPKTGLDGKLAHIVLVPNPDHNPDGDFGLVDGLIRNDGENRYTFSGVGVYDPALFEGRTEERFPLAPLLAEAIDAGQVSAELYTGHWFDVGTPERLESLRRYLEMRPES